MNTRAKTLMAAAAAGTLTLTGLAGCETGGQSGGLAGAGIGALAGQAIGGNTEATLLGTAIGAGLGYVIGNEADKQEAQREERVNRDMYRSSRVTREPTTVHYPPPNPLEGTSWRVTSLVADDFPDDYASMIVSFQPGNRITTLTTFPNGDFDQAVERYRVVGDTLVINGSDYIINASFDVEGEELIVSAPNFRATMERVAG